MFVFQTLFVYLHNELRVMEIYTSYFGNIRKLKEAGIVPIGISLGRNRYVSCRYLPYLAPRKYMLDDKISEDEYTKMYKEHILARVNINTLREDIRSLSDNATKDVALLCYEKPPAFCHRHLFAEWMKEKTGYKITEFGLDGKRQPEAVQGKLF